MNVQRAAGFAATIGGPGAATNSPGPDQPCIGGLMTSDSNGSTDLYRFFDAGGRLLYVGISLSAARRAAQHKADKSWWPEVARMEIERLTGDRDSAMRREVEVIGKERPVYNVMHNGNHLAKVATPKTQRLPVEVGEVYAFAMTDGTCLVGLVSEVWWPDEFYTRFQIEIELYHWLYGYFNAGTMCFDWAAVTSTLKADKRREGKNTLYEMDPLADFQTRTVERSARR